METIKQYPIASSLVLSTLLGLLLSVIPGWTDPVFLPLTVMFVSLFLIYPFVLTVINLVFCIRRPTDALWRRALRRIEAVTMVLGVLFSLLLASSGDIDFMADWTVALEYGIYHSPVWPAAWPTVICFALVGFGGYLSLSFRDFKQMPPLWIVLSISAVYMGMAVNTLWIVQLFDFENPSLLLCLLPLNWIFICIRIIREKAADWRQMEEEEKRRFVNPLLESVNQKVMDSGTWPVWAFLLAWPLVGICIMVLALFGQRPDNIVRAWTETSQWTLSTRISPPSLMSEGHYLCTVAACGHMQLVKPVRMGVRGGQPIVVNRQLCVANAFEQILSQRCPAFHKKVRDFYDAYGLPVARHIRSPFASDVVYLLMKPLEWLFLAVIYLNDPRPEDRISMQYIPSVPDSFPASF